MSVSLREQLSSLPIPRTTTVLRVNLDLLETVSTFTHSTQLVEQWWNAKAKPYGISIAHDTPNLSFSQGSFKVEFARTDDTFALAMEEPDATVRDRIWLCDFDLKLNDGQPQFSVRVSYRQPHNLLLYPEPRAPRFLRDIVEKIGATDYRIIESNPRLIAPEQLPDLIDLIQSKKRTLPVIAISIEDWQTETTIIKPEDLAKYLSGAAHVVKLDWNASWELSKVWGNDWSTFQGAIRCYNPDFEYGSDKYAHRLWLPESIRRINASRRDGFINSCVAHVFAQDTARFEHWPLLTPSSIRRKLENEARQEVIDTQSIANEDLEVLSETALKDAVQVIPVIEFAKELEEIKAKDQLIEYLQRRNEQLSLQLEDKQNLLRDSEQKSDQIKQESLTLNAELSDVLQYRDYFREEADKLDKENKQLRGEDSGETSETLIPFWKDFSAFFKSMQNVASYLRLVEDEASKILNLEEELRELKAQKGKLEATNNSLSRKQTSSVDTEESEILRLKLISILPLLAQKNPPLEHSLSLLQLLFPSRIAVLDTAIKSAKESSNFLHGKQAFEKLWLLATDYWEGIQSGKGDVVAKRVYGNSYAPREKSALSRAGEQRRTFDYQNHSIVMLKHLKIGTADNLADTLRIHFEWLDEEKMIVIGHCGKHLDF